MIELHVKMGTQEIIEAMRRSPVIMNRHAEAGLDEGAQVIARGEKQLAPKATSILTNSIQVKKPAALVRQIIAGADYADFANEGTGVFGPHGIPSGKMPPRQSLLDWIRVKRIIPLNPEMSQEGLALVISRSISKKGTKASHFADKAAEQSQDDAFRRVEKHLEAGVQEVLNS